MSHKGKKSHMQAIKKAINEYEIYKQNSKDELTRVEKDFVHYIDNTAKSLKGK